MLGMVLKTPRKRRVALVVLAALLAIGVALWIAQS